jgi:3-oxo-5-alpha-steroid 4-dehydrogenase 3
MWIGHYILGHLFYLTMNISVWIEGVQALSSPSSSSPIELALPSPMQALVLAILASAHVGQHSYHTYLSSLRTTKPSYSLPAHPLFPNTLCPHYMLEVLIYICLALLAAPDGRLVNWTVATGVLFVAVNLGVTAQGTKEWYVEQFGKEKVASRWKMVPGIW